MRKEYGIGLALILVSFVVTGICIAFMPDQVPMHYDAAGVADRIGSKYETLLFPAATLLIGAFLLGMARYQRKKQELGNEKVLLRSGIVLLVGENLLFGYFLYRAMSSASAEAGEIPDLSLKLLCILLGALLCCLGNLMPKARKNAVFGLRTSWSMKNQRVWQKSQRFGGISMVVCGFLTLLLGIFLPNSVCLPALLAVLTLTLLVDLWASHHIYQKDRQLHPEEKTSF